MVDRHFMSFIRKLSRILFQVILLLACFSVYSQEKSRLDHFRDLSRPEKWWVLTHPFSASRALEISLHARKVSEKLSQNPFLDADGRGGQIDAFRHAYWMALLTQELNARRAWRLGYDHEKGNKLDHLNNKGTTSRWLPTEKDCTMDMFNNDAGIAIGLKYPDATREEMKNIIISKLLKGHFIILKKDDHGYLLDCAGNKINRDHYFHSWENPVCLVPSDYNSRAATAPFIKYFKPY